eukprot:COSAG02_NODE_882_length_16211_cov_27.762103_1_plen_349_part_00
MTAVEAAQLDGEDCFTVGGAALRIESGQHSSVSDTGLAVWDGALILSKFLELEVKRSVLKGAAVLDLGAGCGMTSIVAAALGARVSATDLPYSLALLQRNVDSNAELLAAAGGSVAVGSLDWLSTVNSGKLLKSCLDVARLLDTDFDIVLAADVIWDAELVEPLLCTIERALMQQEARNGIAAAGTNRASSQCFVAEQPSTSVSMVSCCCCKLLPMQERSMAAVQLACEMGLDDLCEAPASASGVICAEGDWLAGQRERQVPVCYLAYTFRLDSVDAALQRGLRGGEGSSDTDIGKHKHGRSRFCVSEVPAHRVPWQSLGRGGGQRDCSDESSPPVRIFRVQLPCGAA